MQKTEDNKNSLTQNKENDRLDLYIPYHTTKKPLKINNFKGFRERETGIEPVYPSCNHTLENCLVCGWGLPWQPTHTLPI